MSRQHSANKMPCHWEAIRMIFIKQETNNHLRLFSFSLPSSHRPDDALDLFPLIVSFSSFNATNIRRTNNMNVFRFHWTARCRLLLTPDFAYFLRFQFFLCGSRNCHISREKIWLHFSILCSGKTGCGIVWLRFRAQKYTCWQQVGDQGWTTFCIRSHNKPEKKKNTLNKT